MWTRTALHNPKQIWTPNHFVALIKDQISLQIDSFLDFPPLLSSPSITASIVTSHTNDKVYTKESQHEQIISIDNIAEQVADIDSASDSVTDTSVEPQVIPSVICLPNAQNMTALFTSAIDSQLPMVKAIPKGF